MSRLAELLKELANLLSAAEEKQERRQSSIFNGASGSSVTLERDARFSTPDGSVIELQPGEYHVRLRDLAPPSVDVDDRDRRGELSREVQIDNPLSAALGAVGVIASVAARRWRASKLTPECFYSATRHA